MSAQDPPGEPQRSAGWVGARRMLRSARANGRRQPRPAARDKVRRVAFGVAVVAILGATFLYGFASSARRLPPYQVVVSVYRTLVGSTLLQRVTQRLAQERDTPPGRWRTPLGRESGSLTGAEVAKLESLGYASGVKLAPTRRGVTAHDRARAYDGLNLVVSGHAPEATLVDMKGKVLHRWSRSFFEAFPDASVSPRLDSVQFWRRARLLPGGELLAIFDNHGLIKIDRGSRILWAAPVSAHHDLDLSDEGHIYVLTRQIGLLPRIHKYRAVIEDFITVLDGDGRLIRRVSLLEAFERSPYAPLLAKRNSAGGDFFHTNTLEILDGTQASRSPAFRRGNVLISLRELDVVAVVDLQLEAVTWALTGQWRSQHQPTLLDNGTLLLFDNLGRGGLSKVLELDPLSQEVRWSYPGSSGSGLFSLTIGSCQRLPNDNTLITESEAGRAFEVTPELKIVWEYVSPHRTGPNDELVATLFEVVRIESESAADWLFDGETDRVAPPISPP